MQGRWCWAAFAWQKDGGAERTPQGLWEALLFDAALLVFFLVYTFVFNWGFDRPFGLPAAAAQGAGQGA